MCATLDSNICQRWCSSSTLIQRYTFRLGNFFLYWLLAILQKLPATQSILKFHAATLQTQQWYCNCTKGQSYQIKLCHTLMKTLPFCDSIRPLEQNHKLLCSVEASFPHNKHLHPDYNYPPWLCF